MIMADSRASRDESLSMYRYLCDHVVGSEKTVTTIRMLNTARDNLSYVDDMICITSGSFGEGLEMRGSDLDMMLAIKDVEVYEDVKSIPYDCSMTSLVMESAKHGFTKLRLARSYNFKLDWACVTEGNIRYLSSGLFRSTMKMIMNNTVIHGPCVSDKDGELDLTISFQSKTWINPAHQWITRSSGSWPSSEVKSTIVDHGVLFVPIGVKGSPDEELEWRMSFSVGEIFLLNSFCHTQLLCYALMKILLKDVISVKPGCQDLLCSFFIKNIIFWICEEQPSNIWTPEYLLPCFMECFKRLIYCVKYSVCPHYFIPENNLFENKIEGYNKTTLLNVLYTLYRRGWKCILFSDQFCKRQFDFRTIRNRTHMQVAYLSNISRAFHIRRAINRAVSPTEFYKKMIYVIFRCVSRARSYYLYSMSLLLYDNAQYIPVTSINGNKKQYIQYRTSLAYLLQSIYHDAVSGWLMLASLFYQTKQYKKGLYILSYVMSKFTPEKVYCQIRLSLIQLQLLSTKSIKDLGKFNVLKFMSLHRLFFSHYSTLIPKEIDKEPKMMRLISPVVFCHLLSFLCHYQLKDVYQCRIAVRYLYQTIEEKYFIADSREQARAYRYLGVALMLLGERTRAEHAFLKSTELDEGDDASLQYLYMLNDTHS